MRSLTVAAAYSKRKRQDTQVLHPEFVAQLREWFETKTAIPENALLFPVSGRVPGGVHRRTSKMMEADLNAAREKWIKEAKTDKEKRAREKSDFLKYQNASGLFADFHSNRHTFITNLERVGVSPRRAQSLARHSDIRLTMGTYTHINLHEQSSAIELLPAPPVVNGNGKAKPAKAADNGLSKLDAIWDKLPADVKAQILSLAVTSEK
jgi:integrase/recombinase XerD